jgi:hypothetical protein
MGLIPCVFFLLFLFYSSAYDIDDETRQDDAPSSHSIPASLFSIHFFLEHTIWCSRSVTLLVLLRFINRCRTHESIHHGVYGLVRRYEEFAVGYICRRGITTGVADHNSNSKSYMLIFILLVYVYRILQCCLRRACSILRFKILGPMDPMIT